MRGIVLIGVLCLLFLAGCQTSNNTNVCIDDNVCTAREELLNNCNDCKAEGYCGNGILEEDREGSPEQCDDGNDVNGDGCTTQCKVEPYLNSEGFLEPKVPDTQGFYYINPEESTITLGGEDVSVMTAYYASVANAVGLDWDDLLNLANGDASGSHEYGDPLLTVSKLDADSEADARANADLVKDEIMAKLNDVESKVYYENDAQGKASNYYYVEKVDTVTKDGAELTINTQVYTFAGVHGETDATYMIYCENYDRCEDAAMVYMQHLAYQADSLPLFYQCSQADSRDDSNVPCSDAAADKGHGTERFKTLVCTREGNNQNYVSADWLRHNGNAWQLFSNGNWYGCNGGTVVMDMAAVDDAGEPLYTFCENTEFADDGICQDSTLGDGYGNEKALAMPCYVQVGNGKYVSRDLQRFNHNDDGAWSVYGDSNPTKYTCNGLYVASRDSTFDGNVLYTRCSDADSNDASNTICSAAAESGGAGDGSYKVVACEVEINGQEILSADWLYHDGDDWYAARNGVTYDCDNVIVADLNAEYSVN